MSPFPTVTPWELLQSFAAATFCGALIGVEREMGKSQARTDPEQDTVAAADSNPAGIRTHMLFALTGAIFQRLDQVAGTSWIYTTTGLALAGLATLALYTVRAMRTGNYGATSVPTLLATYALGALSLHGERLAAAAMAVGVTGVLAVKAPLHRFVGQLRRDEIGAAVKFGLIALVLLPLLPDRNFGPLDWGPAADVFRQLGAGDSLLRALEVFNPFKLWTFVVVISGIGMLGHVFVRSLGSGRGLTVTGIAGGMVSSTAVSLAMSQQSRRSPATPRPFIAAILAANAVMVVRVFVLVLLYAAPLIPTVAAPLGVMLVVAMVGTWRASRLDRDEQPSGEAMNVSTPFALVPALKLAAVFLVIRVVARVMTVTFGGAGFVATAAIAGLVDVDSITTTASQEFTGDPGTLTRQVAATVIFTAVAVNTLVKAGLIRIFGSPGVARGAVIWLMLKLLAGAAALGIAALL